MAQAASTEQTYRLVAAALDAGFYRATYADVDQAGIDPVRHYLDEGWQEGRDPAPWFSTTAYLEANPDVVGINPFHHYLASGWREGREAYASPARGRYLWTSADARRSVAWTYEPPGRPDAPADPYLQDHGRRPGGSELGFRHDVVARLVPVARRIEAAARRAAEVPAGALGHLESALAQTRAASGGLHVTISHDNFTAHVGGVQLCLQREAAAIAAKGADHLHLYPPTPWPTLRPDDVQAPVGVLWNGRDLGAFHAATVVEALTRWREGRRSGRRTFAVHSLLGHAVDEVLAILRAAGLSKGWFWLHDFASLCAGIHLMRDDVADCAAPPADSAGCGICIYGPYRQDHVRAHARLFAGLDLTVVAPSQSAYDTWRAASSAPADQPHVIHPHARLAPRGQALAPAAGALSVAFLGMPGIHKGWPVFEALAERFAEDDRYRFLHLGSAPAATAKVEFHPISVSADRPFAMREALDRFGVDVALIWSLCRETFSFTAYEAVAAGAAVLTGPDSGNVAAFVSEGDRGLVLACEDDLMRLFESGDALALTRAARQPPAYDLVHGALTVDLLGAR